MAKKVKRVEKAGVVKVKPVQKTGKEGKGEACVFCGKNTVSKKDDGFMHCRSCGQKWEVKKAAKVAVGKMQEGEVAKKQKRERAPSKQQKHFVTVEGMYNGKKVPPTEILEFTKPFVKDEGDRPFSKWDAVTLICKGECTAHGMTAKMPHDTSKLVIKNGDHIVTSRANYIPKPEKAKAAKPAKADKKADKKKAKK
jgi:ribosomal protein L37AE/L43A